MENLSYEKPTITLSNTDGNAFSIMGKILKAMRKAGAKKEEINSFIKEATSGDYDHLLQTCFKYVEIE